MECKKGLKVKLSDVGKDERWLQDKIIEDPTILGLGNLVVIPLENPQYKGGKSDFLMYDPENSVRYEVKIILGILDENHINKIIEYWDEKRKRHPNLEYRAVILVEEVASRFFDFFSLLNKAIPIVAIQLIILTDENLLFLNFVKVLSLPNPIDEERQEDRKYLVPLFNRIGLADAVAKNDKTISGIEVTYSKSRIGWGIS